ncbi:hypothetical protein C8R45DRAFT_1114827 [Mycena sanguinolenta]|nr:hypothetical protein C8R45DRAFT_1114827 [Mycena sanguinolenta]
MGRRPHLEPTPHAGAATPMRHTVAKTPNIHSRARAEWWPEMAPAHASRVWTRKSAPGPQHRPPPSSTSTGSDTSECAAESLLHAHPRLIHSYLRPRPIHSYSRRTRERPAVPAPSRGPSLHRQGTDADGARGPTTMLADPQRCSRIHGTTAQEPVPQPQVHSPLVHPVPLVRSGPVASKHTALAFIVPVHARAAGSVDVSWIPDIPRRDGTTHHDGGEDAQHPSERTPHIRIRTRHALDPRPDHPLPSKTHAVRDQ